jgi:tetratricopeptide (TPR) repeat protein
MPAKRTIHVFIASPGDLAVERRAFKEVVDELNKGFGDGKDIEFVPLGWEDTLATTGRRSQAVINQDVDRSDVFILAMHRRWGQEAPDAKPYSSYTEEEFHRAYERWKKDPPAGKERAPEIFVFFKHIDPGQMADPGVQLQKVLDFRKHLEESRQVLYRPFVDAAEFKVEVDRHLRAYAKGELPKADAPLDKVLLPLDVLAEIQKEKAEKERALIQAEREHKLAEAAVARAEKFALEFAERAATAALDGKIEEARQDFAKATDGSANLRVLYLAYDFYERTGDLATAEELLNRWLSISGPDTETADTAAALGNLGLLYRTRGELDRAEEMHKKSLAISEKLGRQEGMASQYGNLGLIYQTRGELDRAEEMHKKALAINEKLGRQEGMASQYCALGLIYKAHGEYDQAEEMHNRALEIETKLGSRVGIAREYGWLGTVHLRRGAIDRAEDMHTKSLAIWEALGHQEGMASEYGNLGVIYRRRGELDRAEEMHKKSLAIDEKLGRQEGMANQYGNLGLIYETRGELDRARELWTKARDLFAKIGMSHMVKQMQEWLDGLPGPGAK